MKKTILGTVVCLGAAIASAQTMRTVHVNLPFATKVGGVSLPAGAYSIHEVMNSVIEISSDAHNGVSTFATVNSIVAPKGEVADHSKVVLQKSNDGYQIQKIWLEGEDMGFELTSAAE